MNTLSWLELCSFEFWRVEKRRCKSKGADEGMLPIPAPQCSRGTYAVAFEGRWAPTLSRLTRLRTPSCRRSSLRRRNCGWSIFIRAFGSPGTIRTRVCLYFFIATFETYYFSCEQLEFVGLLGAAGVCWGLALLHWRIEKGRDMDRVKQGALSILAPRTKHRTLPRYRSAHAVSGLRAEMGTDDFAVRMCFK